MGITHFPNKSWNADETGVGDKVENIAGVGIRGEDLSRIVGREQPENTSVVYFCSGGGIRCPPMIIFKGSRLSQEVRQRAGTFPCLVRCSQNGYINTELFTEYALFWLQWIKDEGLYIRGETVLLLDQHKTHVYNETFLTTMRRNGIVVLALPSGTTQTLQPLDDVPFANLKREWKSQLERLNEQLAGQRIPKPDILTLLNRVQQAALTPDVIRRGWQNCGLFPFNPQVSKISRLRSNPAARVQDVDDSESESEGSSSDSDDDDSEEKF